MEFFKFAAITVTTMLVVFGANSIRNKRAEEKEANKTASELTADLMSFKSKQ